MLQTELIDRTDEAALNARSAEIPVERAQALVDLFARATTSRDADAFVSGFTDDRVVRFNTRELRGRDLLGEFIASSFSRFPDSHRCEKTLRSISGNVLGFTWRSSWQDPRTNKPMEGRELAIGLMRGDRIARWDTTFSM
jgi:nuclear transport factor 2 (NTF2) superfamily protein